MFAGLRTIGSVAKSVASRPSATFIFLSCSCAASAPEPASRCAWTLKASAEAPTIVRQMDFMLGWKLIATDVRRELQTLYANIAETHHAFWIVRLECEGAFADL